MTSTDRSEALQLELKELHAISRKWIDMENRIAELEEEVYRLRQTLDLKVKQLIIAGVAPHRARAVYPPREF